MAPEQIRGQAHRRPHRRLRRRRAALRAGGRACTRSAPARSSGGRGGAAGDVGAPATCWRASSPRIRRRSRRDRCCRRRPWPWWRGRWPRAPRASLRRRPRAGRGVARAAGTRADAVALGRARPRRGARSPARTIGASRSAGGWSIRRRWPRSSRWCWCRPGWCGATSSRSRCALALRLILLFSVAAGVSVRLHLWFVARYRVGRAGPRAPRGPAVARRDQPRVRRRRWRSRRSCCSTGTPATASVFFGLAVVHAVVSVMVEPATNRAFTVPHPMSREPRR